MLLLHGKADGRGGFRVSHHAVGQPAALARSPLEGLGSEQASAAGAVDSDVAGAVAHYPAADGVTSTQILTLVQAARGALRDVTEPLPAATRVSEGLPDRASALAAMHFPRDERDTEAGRQRLAFEELLLTQLVFLRRRARRRTREGAHVMAEPPSLTERWLAGGLPFALTDDQRRAIEEIEMDMRRPCAMQRLLMGEVGSGKTVVALHAMLRAVEHGLQAALMAPTETLAEQHFATIQRLIGAEPLNVALLTGSTPASRRKDMLGKLDSGELSLIVGTHALIEPEVRFRALAVAVVDEQHRFGVRQRAALDEKGTPHMLHMTATPIPRTLALARYGDLDASTLRQLPLGRKAIDTRVVAGESGRERAYEELREHLRAGRQAYVVCPLIEEEDVSAGGVPATTTPPAEGGIRAATAELERLREGELRGYDLVLLHGGLRPREKQEAMAAFASGQAHVLVATTVIEVGIDVPECDAHAGRERGALRDLPAAPAARAGRARRASGELPVDGAARLGEAARDGGALRRLPAGRDRPRPAQGGRARGHAPVRCRPVQRGLHARGRPAARAGASARRGDRRDRSGAPDARARLAGAGARTRVRSRAARADSRVGQRLRPAAGGSPAAGGGYGDAHAGDRGTARRQAADRTARQGDQTDLRSR